MAKQEKLINNLLFFILFFATGCLFTDPINEEVNSDFTYRGEFKVNKPVELEYKQKDKKAPDLRLYWKIEELPPHSSMSNYSFLPSETDTVRVFTPDVPGNYKVSLRVEDKYHAQSKTIKTIKIKNTLPVAVIKCLNGISDFIVYRRIYFDASNSYDKDYKTLASYEWKIISAPKGFDFKNITSDKKTFSFVPSLKGNYSVKLTVTDINNDSNYTTYSFFVNDITTPLILKTIPDNNINPMPLKKGKQYRFKALFTDKITPKSEISYKWTISINNSDFFNLSNSDELIFTPQTYGTGDIIKIKLRITNKLNNYSEVKWKLVITE